MDLNQKYMLTKMKIEPCIEEVLRRGADDWMSESEVACVAKFTGGANSQDEIRELSLEIISSVVTGGFMEIGDIKTGTFTTWPNLENDAFTKISREWRALKRYPQVSEICWLKNTEKGDTRAQKIAK